MSFDVRGAWPQILLENNMQLFDTLNDKKATAEKQFLNFSQFLDKMPSKSTFMRPKIKIMPAIVDFGSRGLTDPSFGRIGDGPETPPPDLGEALKKPLLSVLPTQTIVGTIFKCDSNQ